MSIEFLVGRRFIGVLPLSLPSPRAPFPHAQITAFLAVCISHGTTSCITRHCMETSHEHTPRHEHSTPWHNTFHRSPFICTNYAIHLYQLLHTARSLPILRLTTSIDAALAPSLHSCVPTSSHHMNCLPVYSTCTWNVHITRKPCAHLLPHATCFSATCSFCNRFTTLSFLVLFASGPPFRHADKTRHIRYALFFLGSN